MSQRLSMGRCWEDVHHLFCAILVVWYVFCKNGFVHHGCSVALQLLFSMCWTWSRQRRRRRRRPHDLHVRCLEVHGTIHMMVAKSASWSYLKRAWDNDPSQLLFSKCWLELKFMGDWRHAVLAKTRRTPVTHFWVAISWLWAVLAQCLAKARPQQQVV